MSKHHIENIDTIIYSITVQHEDIQLGKKYSAQIEGPDKPNSQDARSYLIGITTGAYMSFITHAIEYFDESTEFAHWKEVSIGIIFLLALSGFCYLIPIFKEFFAKLHAKMHK